MKITGNTQVFFVIADPIGQVRAPELFNRVFELHGVDAVVVPLQVAADDFEPTVRALFRSPSTGGVFLSIPHKPAALTVADRCSELAEVAGAVNALRRGRDGAIEGELFDGLGFVKALDDAHIAYAGRRVLLIGAGGAASAAAATLAARGTSEIAIFDPVADKAMQLASRIVSAFRIDAYAAASNDPAGYDLVVNVSPLGMKTDDPVPFDVARLDDGAAVFDVLMKNQPTPLVRAARARGLTAEPGFEMLIQQAPLYLRFFGLEAAASGIENDASALRAMIYPPELLDSHRLS
ncbi:shikimate dehydrogenase [Crenobacter sp. SG2303]|uniref:Shikimate dehydrogenase n=1 Tax=Crenobacter oryzisoli TaxID=3056844 RepID=A0ABT7XMZ0_9NEIS|nr:shikimate dehydrogenase [Crenobacter sp. SG2303]MDN0075163.1 shikimate dehydrogenase [Crenobacter sp. SG2303]